MRATHSRRAVQLRLSARGGRFALRCVCSMQPRSTFVPPHAATATPVHTLLSNPMSLIACAWCRRAAAWPRASAGPQGPFLAWGVGVSSHVQGLTVGFLSTGGIASRHCSRAASLAGPLLRCSCGKGLSRATDATHSFFRQRLQMPVSVPRKARGRDGYAGQAQPRCAKVESVGCPPSFTQARTELSNWPLALASLDRTLFIQALETAH